MNDVLVSFAVRGLPQVQGNLRAVGSRVFHKRSPELEAWRHAIATAASSAMGDRPPLDEAVSVDVIFRLPRPTGHFGKRGLRGSAPVFPVTRLDIDKLARSLLDALTGVAIRDDVLVVDLCALKRYGEVPGCEVEISRAEL
jgi:crossover junction endodeoxyribonuclease RusA